MSENTIDTLVGSLGEGWTLYDETQDNTPTYVAMGPGLYPAHITKVEIVDRNVLKKYKATIYNLHVKIADDAKNRTFKAKSDGVDVEVDGGQFVGREIRSQGVFKFLTPKPDEDFEQNPGGNKKYMAMVEALGIEAPVVEVEVGGEKRKIKTLPNVTEMDLLGKPMIAGIGFSKPWKDKTGKERRSLEVKSIRVWEEGKTIDISGDVDEDDIPF